MGDTIGIAQRQYTHLELTIVPGGALSSTMVYEDDGASVDYVRGKFMQTTIKYGWGCIAVSFQHYFLFARLHRYYFASSRATVLAHIKTNN